jgi:hypothetical protein
MFGVPLRTAGHDSTETYPAILEKLEMSSRDRYPHSNCEFLLHTAKIGAHVSDRRRNN